MKVAWLILLDHDQLIWTAVACHLFPCTQPSATIYPKSLEVLEKLWYSNGTERLVMSKTIETAMKLIESLPEHEQARVVKALRHLVQDVQDEARWDQLFNRDTTLTAAARQARKDVSEGKASDMDFERL
jgi:hypothetical protein